jgi:3-demethoxyubiquinol 3-hydroxylase
MFINNTIALFDNALRTLNNVGVLSRPYPPALSPVLALLPELNQAQRKHSAGLMRVNHVGEVCAQALYVGQAMITTTPHIKAFNQHAAQEEWDHLLWTFRRLSELDARPSLLNPIWYLGALSLGVVAGALGDSVSLAFVKETESQVEAHLHSHESQLPTVDWRSLAIVRQMKHDEAEHGAQAMHLGALDLPTPVRLAMRASAKVMTHLAYYF